ncbi:hypothetical protein [Methylosarcina fibrata]|uniref:hypothetical protein n=1 Tax=Methylosarcina fibrata TaxID=105972 RepID=UPI000377A7EF|nr:hypothetical protein [Methylosarcina fibrata]
MNTASLTIRVDCSTGYREEQTPRRFFMGDKAVDIEEILDRWLSPEYSYFKVRGADGDIYILRHDQLTRRWQLTLFQSGKYGGGPLSSA